MADRSSSDSGSIAFLREQLAAVRKPRQLVTLKEATLKEATLKEATLKDAAHAELLVLRRNELANGGAIEETGLNEAVARNITISERNNL